MEDPASFVLVKMPTIWCAGSCYLIAAMGKEVEMAKLNKLQGWERNEEVKKTVCL